MSLKPQSFKVGEKIVYPSHGVTVVENIGESNISGLNSTYYHLRLLANDSKLMVPITNGDRVGLRPLYGKREVKALLGQLEEKIERTQRDWKDRYRSNLEKMKSGKLEDVAEVLKHLHMISQRKSLSFREKKMYDRAKYLLLSEVAIVKGISESEAENLIDKLLGKAMGADH